jgi:hypothetical protein
MSFCEHTAISSNSAVTIDTGKSVYFIDTTIDQTYTLPTITSTGSHYLFTRKDNNSATVTLQTSGGNLITDKFGVTLSSILIENLMAVEIHSIGNIWYALYKNVNSRLEDGYFSTAFKNNKGEPFVSFNTQAITLFPYEGADIHIIRMIYISASTTTGTYQLGYTDGTGYHIVCSIAAGSLLYFLTSTDIQRLPRTPSVLRFETLNGPNVISCIVVF